MALISVVVPTLNAGPLLAETLRSLRPAGEADAARVTDSVAYNDDLVAETLIVDGGSTDDTAAVAAALGARCLTEARGRGVQLAAGARAAAAEWLLFLHGDTRLGLDWRAAARAFVMDPANRERAAVFRFALDSAGRPARRVERLVAWRNRWLKLPYGDQGLLLHRGLYGRMGGYPEIPLMEDVALVRRLGRRRITVLPATATTSAARYAEGGYIARPLRNMTLLSLFYLGVPPRLLARLYG